MRAARAWVTFAVLSLVLIVFGCGRKSGDNTSTTAPVANPGKADSCRCTAGPHAQGRQAVVIQFIVGKLEPNPKGIKLCTHVHGNHVKPDEVQWYNSTDTTVLVKFQVTTPLQGGRDTVTVPGLGSSNWLPVDLKASGLFNYKLTFVHSANADSTIRQAGTVDVDD